MWLAKSALAHKKKPFGAAKRLNTLWINLNQSEDKTHRSHDHSIQKEIESVGLVRFRAKIRSIALRIAEKCI